MEKAAGSSSSSNFESLSFFEWAEKPEDATFSTNFVVKLPGWCALVENFSPKAKRALG